MSAASFWVVRHAPLSEKGLCYGQSDLVPPLAPHAAAAEVRSRLPERPIRIVTSPLARCRSLAEALATVLGLPPPAVRAEAQELSFGDWELRRWDELEMSPAFGPWMRAWQTARPPGGESAPELQHRVAQLLADTALLDGALLVTHAGPIRVLRALTRGLTLDQAWAEGVPYLTPERLTARRSADPRDPLRSS